MHVYQGLLAVGGTDGQIHFIARHCSVMACCSVKQKPVLKGLINKGNRIGAEAHLCL